MTWCDASAIGYKNEGNHELFLEAHRELADSVLPNLPRWNSLLSPLLPGMAFEMASAETLPGKGIIQAIHNPHEGSLNTGMLISELQRKVVESGCSILTGITVTQWQDGDSFAEVNTQLGNIRCGALLFASNGFTRELLPDLEVYPARNQVLVTSAIPDLPWKGTFHLDRGYFYFRELDGRLLIGGGRHLAGSSENTSIPNTTPDVISRLEHLLQNHLLPGINYRVEMQWAGILGVGPNREVIVRKTGKRSACAVRLGGMGVALGSLMGRKLAEIALKIES
jgi:glycine/D-amino acid oxidase-like deaminating enzyme